MAVELQPITRRTIQHAATNYIDCLALPEQSQVLVVTDTSKDATDQNVQVRRKMASILQRRLHSLYPVGRVEFTHGMEDDDIFEKTSDALADLDSRGAKKSSEDRTTAVIYIGDAWANRSKMYNAVSDFGARKTPGTVRVAGSLGFSTGDCRVMSRMGRNERKKIATARDYFTKFMQDHPDGRLNITTLNLNPDSMHTLSLQYNTSLAPFASEVGVFDTSKPVYHGNFMYMNIPGGEMFGTPNPFQKTEGSFVAGGIIFTVNNGTVVDARDAKKGAIETMQEPSQKLLLDRVRNGRSVPVCELGLGFYALSGMQTYPDSSVLSSEKGGPHIGMGHVANKSNEEDAIAKAAGDFHHTDFIMDGPFISHEDLQTGEYVVFYPPQKSN